MKKRFIPIALLASAALVLSGCSSSSNDSGSSDGAQDGAGQTINVWLMRGTQPDMTDFYKEVSDEFTKQTGATVKIEEVPWADAKTRFQTAIAGGTTPDVAEIGNTWTPEYADAGVLLPLDDMVKKAGLENDMVEGLKDSGVYKDELYGMPFYTAIRALMYRSDIMTELGLEAPKTWDDIITVGNAIKAAHPEMITFPVPGDAEMSAYPWIWGGGGEVATENNGEWTSELDSAKSREGIKFFTDLALKHGFSTQGATTWKETDILDNFANGSVAMAVQGSWTPNAIFEKNPAMEGKLAATTIPGKTGGISPSAVGGSHLGIFDTTKNKELSFEFVKLMTSGDLAKKFVDETGFFPGQKSLLEPALESDNPLVTGFAKQLIDGGAAVPVTPTFGAVQAKKTTQTMMQAILSGQKSVDEATSEATKEMTDLLNGNN